MEISIVESLRFKMSEGKEDHEGLAEHLLKLLHPRILLIFSEPVFSKK